MDFAAWFEAYLDGHWHTFDARNNSPPHRACRRGARPRRGRCRTDYIVGPLTLTDFEVRAERYVAAPSGT